MHIKTTMRYHLTPAKMAIINKWTNNSAGEDVKKRDPSALLVGIKTGADSVENSVEVPHKI